MSLPEAYIPQMVLPPATPPVTAADTMNVLAAAERLRDTRRAAAIQQMQDQVDQQAKNMLAGNWLASASPQPPAATTSPQPAAPANPLAAAPGAQPPDFLGAFQATQAPAQDEIPRFADEKYEIKVPGRPTTKWLQQYLVDNNLIGDKQAVQAAMALDADTQRLKQQQEAVYNQQISEYSSLTAARREQILQIPDEKKRKEALTSFLEEGKKALASNPIAQRNADMVINNIKKGYLPGPDGTATAVLNVPDPATNPAGYEAAHNKLKPFLPEGIQPTPGVPWKIDMKGKAIVGASEVSGDLSGKEPPKSEAMWLKGRVAQLIKSGIPKADAEAQAAKEYEERLDSRAANKAKVVVNIREAAKSKAAGAAGDDFKKWDAETKQWWFENRRDTGEMPKFGYGRGAQESQKQFTKEYAQWNMGKGVTGAEAKTEGEQFKADVASNKVQKRAYDASGSFIKTIDNNISQLEDHIKTMSKTMNLDRNRLLNMGVREFNKKLIGTANINIYEMLTAAISTETAKLQSGGAGSVAQVAEAARLEMKKIHDDNLPVSEMLKLMKATRKEGGNRIKGISDQLKEIDARLKKKDRSLVSSQPSGSKDKGQLDRAGALRFLQRAGGDADKARELARKEGYTF